MISPDSGSANGLSITRVMELMKIKNKMIPSKILAVTFLFLFPADFLAIDFVPRAVDVDRVFLYVFDICSLGANEMIYYEFFYFICTDLAYRSLFGFYGTDFSASFSSILPILLLGDALNIL